MRLVSEKSVLEELSHDAGIISMRPQFACYAPTEADVVSVIEEGIRRGMPIVPRGGGTSIPSQSIGTGLTLIQEGGTTFMDGEVVVTHPAVTKADLNTYVSGQGRWMPVDPSSYRSCSLGGMVANNSSGIRTPKYGSTVDYVCGLRAVVPGSAPEDLPVLKVEESLRGASRIKRLAEMLLDNRKEIREETPRVTKNSSGYRLERVVHDGVVDLPRLFTGSEGTLGVITQVRLKTLTPPRWRLLLILESSLDDLGPVVQACRGLKPSAVELVDKSIFRRVGREDKVANYSRSGRDYMVFCELDGNRGEADEKVGEVAESKVGTLDPLVLTEQSEIATAWEVRNETLTMALEIKRDGKTMLPGVEDLVVPPENLGDLVRLLTDQFGKRGLESISYGHAGDANLHARPLLDAKSPKDRRILDDVMQECFEAVWKLGGSMSGEHGDGMLRGPYVSRQYPRTFWMMKEIRQAFDPKRLLSPGVKIV